MHLKQENYIFSHLSETFTLKFHEIIAFAALKLVLLWVTRT